MYKISYFFNHVKQLFFAGNIPLDTMKNQIENNPTLDELKQRISILEAALEDIRDCTFMLEDKEWTWQDISKRQSKIAADALDNFPVNHPTIEVL